MAIVAAMPAAVQTAMFLAVQVSGFIAAPASAIANCLAAREEDPNYGNCLAGAAMTSIASLPVLAGLANFLGLGKRDRLSVELPLERSLMKIKYATHSLMPLFNRKNTAFERVADMGEYLLTQEENREKCRALLENKLPDFKKRTNELAVTAHVDQFTDTVQCLPHSVTNSVKLECADTYMSERFPDCDFTDGDLVCSSRKGVDVKWTEEGPECRIKPEAFDQYDINCGRELNSVQHCRTHEDEKIIKEFICSMCGNEEAKKILNAPIHSL